MVNFHSCLYVYQRVPWLRSVSDQIGRPFFVSSGPGHSSDPCIAVLREDFRSKWGSRQGRCRLLVQGGTPPVMWTLVYKPYRNSMSIYLPTIVIGVICTNLANELGHHLVSIAWMGWENCEESIWSFQLQWYVLFRIPGNCICFLSPISIDAKHYCYTHDGS